MGDCSDGSDETRCRSMCSEHNITLSEPGMLRLKYNTEKNKLEKRPTRDSNGVKKNGLKKSNTNFAKMDVFTCFKQFGTSCKKYLNKNGGVDYHLDSSSSSSSASSSSITTTSKI